MEVITNNKPRMLCTWHELNETERADFDYVRDDADAHDEPRFFRYKGNAYDVYEFMAISKHFTAQDGIDASPANETFKGWDGYSNDTYFTGMLIKYVMHDDVVIVARYIA